MNLLKISTLSFLFIFSIFLPANTFAAVEPTPTKAVVIADLSMYDAKIVSINQSTNTYSLSFELSNGAKAQALLYSAVKLIKNTPKGQVVVDEYISSDSFNINSNETIQKTLSYTAPENLSGDYKLLISVINESGVTLGLGFTKDIKLTSSLSNLALDTSSCYISILGDTTNTHYQINQSASIDSTQTLQVNCSVSNPTKEDITGIPAYETYLNNNIMDKISTTGGDNTPITIKAGEKKNITLSIPNVTNPQSYKVMFYLDNNGNPSNKLIFYYTVKGVSATIQNFSLDKDSYVKGETASLSLFWTPSFTNEDNTAKTEVNLSIIIKNSYGTKCIDPIKQPIADTSKPGLVDLSAKVLRDCKSPQVSITLTDKDKNVLDQKDISFGDMSNLENNKKENNMVISIFGILILLGLGIYFINLKKKQNETTNQ